MRANIKLVAVFGLILAHAALAGWPWSRSKSKSEELSPPQPKWTQRMKNKLFKDSNGIPTKMDFATGLSYLSKWEEAVENGQEDTGMMRVLKMRLRDAGVLDEHYHPTPRALQSNHGSGSMDFWTKQHESNVEESAQSGQVDAKHLALERNLKLAGHKKYEDSDFSDVSQQPSNTPHAMMELKDMFPTLTEQIIAYLVARNEQWKRSVKTVLINSALAASSAAGVLYMKATPFEMSLSGSAYASFYQVMMAPKWRRVFNNEQLAKRQFKALITKVIPPEYLPNIINFDVVGLRGRIDEHGLKKLAALYQHLMMCDKASRANEPMPCKERAKLLTMELEFIKKNQVALLRRYEIPTPENAQQGASGQPAGSAAMGNTVGSDAANSGPGQMNPAGGSSHSSVASTGLERGESSDEEEN